MTDNKQTVLTDEQNAIIAARFPDDPANAVRAQSAVVEILSKLRAAGEPVAWTNEAGNVEPISDAVKQARPDLYAKDYTRPLFYAAPQASAEESAIDKPIPDSVEHYGLIDERVGAPAAEYSAKGEEPDIQEKLKDPNVVHVNMLRGTIAPITFDQLAHVLGDEATAKWIADRQQRGGDVDERMAFEASERNRPGYGEDTLTVYTQDAGEYALPLTQARWVGWQARAALAAKPAASAEPAAWVAADTLNSPHPRCISSLAYMSQIDKDRGREYVPLYAAPVAAQKADDARDAERYRWLRVQPFEVWKRIAWNTWGDAPAVATHRDAAIDAAIAQQRQEGQS